MGYEVWFRERLPVETIWVPASLCPAELNRSAARLRCWALVRGSAIIGSPFLTLSPTREPRVHLPLGRPLAPHVTSGMAQETLGAGLIAVVAGIPLEGLLDRLRLITEWLEEFAAIRAAAEYQWGFDGRGLLTVPLVAAVPERIAEPSKHSTAPARFGA